MLHFLQAFAAGYACCRAIDLAFDRDWKACSITVGAAGLMILFFVGGR